jgi:hypothetical protein
MWTMHSRIRRQHPVRQCCAVLILCSGGRLNAAETIQYHGYSDAVELKNKDVRVVLCPEVGGRVLEYSYRGSNVLHFSDQEKQWKPGDKPHSSAGRFDIGPEFIIPRRELLWSGKWQVRITGERAARLTSQQDPATGVQLIRDFELDKESSRLKCRQTIVNVSQQTREWCHWSRTFAVGKGICIIPLTEPEQSPHSRFPMKYVMYEEGGVINAKPKDPNIRLKDNALEIHPTPRKPKLGFDSYAGEIIYLAPNDLMFLKRFRTYPNRVYNEAAGLTISVWYPDREMVELEPIGPRERLAPGESASFTEEWWLAPFSFPANGDAVDHAHVKQTTNSLR